MASNNTSIECDGMDSNEAEIYTELKWWLEGVVHLAISTIGLVANSLSMAVMLSSGKTFLILLGIIVWYKQLRR